MEISESKIKLWSKLGSRATYGQAMLSLPDKNLKVLAMSADLGNSSGLSPFIRKFPEKFINVGIAEQNMIGVAAGLAKEGFVPYVSSFAPFLSMRASEQIRMELGYMQFNVRVVALGSGLAMAFLGNSHFGLEDVSIMRTIPGLTIISPCDCTEIYKTVHATADHAGPVYIRLTGGVNNPVVNDKDYEFKIGKSIKLRDGKDICIISSGTMVAKSIDAAEILLKDGIEAEIINMHTIKPLDLNRIKEVISSNKPIISVEEHTVVGGMGSAISEILIKQKNQTPLKIIGLEDKYGKTASYEHLIKIHNLDGLGIAATIKTFIDNL